MILIKIKERIDFDEWSEHFTYYKNFKVKDYGIKITDTRILKDFFWWDDEKIEVSKVKSIMALTKAELKVLQKFNILDNYLLREQERLYEKYKTNTQSK